MKRYNKIKDIYNYTLTEIVKNKNEWIKFLDFYTRVYKHTFDDVVLIYAQRPNATFVADMKTWNQKVGRWIKKGAKSIAVFDDTKNYPSLKNYFDIKDTTVRQENRFSYPAYWKIDKNNEQLLLSKLQKQYNVDTISEYIEVVALLELEKIKNEIFKDFDKGIKESRLSNFDIEKVKGKFRTTVIESIYYMTKKRCNIDEVSDFKVLCYFNTKPLIFRLGSLVSSISEGILRDIEKQVKEIDRERSQRDGENRARIQTDQRGISRTDTRSSKQPESEHRQIREQGNELSQRGTPTQIQFTKSRGDIDRDDVQSQRRSTQETRDTTRTDVKDRPNTKPRELLRELQTQGNDKITSRGNSVTRDSVQSEVAKTTLSPHLESSYDGSFSLEKISDNQIIDEVLNKGSGFVEGKQRIVDFFAKESTNKERVTFLKNEYGIGGGTLLIRVDDKNQSIGFTSHDAKGISLDIDDGRKIKLTWSKVAKGIDRLINNGEYFVSRYKNDVPPVPKTQVQQTLLNTNNVIEDDDIDKSDNTLKEVDTELEDRIGDYNIPDEVDEMNLDKVSVVVEPDIPEPKKKISNTIPHRNYKKLDKIATGIMEGRYSYLKLKAKGFMDLSIERLTPDRISMTHYYKQNGDLMSDPDMELMINHENETIMAATYRQDGLGIEQQVYLSDGRWLPKLSKQLNSFLNQWLRNIEQQGHKPYEAHLIDYGDKKIGFDEKYKEEILEEDLLSIMAREKEIKKPYNSKNDISIAKSYLDNNVEDMPYNDTFIKESEADYQGEEM
ncbi:hypothetical protein PV797_11225 [Clostridiaceae bacterium M8S5]|nr:hypothetical protein PV797_11225 [Clostridiaceae bacterium M8S5]